MLAAKPSYLLGADEAGRGCLAGDLVVAVVGAAVDGFADETAFLCPEIDEFFREAGLVQDSKAFHREEDRWACADELWSHIHEGRLFMAMRERTSRQVDESGNINDCVNDAWAECVVEIVESISRTDPSAVQESRIKVIIDGNSFRETPTRKMPVPFLNVIRADALVPCVSAASILAKCAHDDSIDRILRTAVSEEQRQHLQLFGWAENKGYATKKHREMIAAHGPSSHHRLSFEPCKSWRRDDSSSSSNIDT